MSDEAAGPGGPTAAGGESERLLAAIDAEREAALELSRWMAAHPELSLEEHETSARYRHFLEARGFGIGGLPGAAALHGSATDDPAKTLPTAFLASHGAPSAPLRIGLLAEMDALPEIGHACGHNLSGPASLLAAVAAARVVDPERARIVVVGCPAEETGLGKARLVELGAFDELDVAMMAHASDMRRAHRLFLGNHKLELVFHGRASHAAAYPEDGINALDGVIGFFVALGLLRQQLPRDVRVHGIVSDGGQAPNVIPERAAARIWVRSLDEERIRETTERVLACARGAAEASGTRLEVNDEAGGSPPMRANLPLVRCYGRQLERLGLAETGHAPGESIGSSDITHVSRVVPTIHPNFPIGERLQLHTRAFAEATTTPAGEAGLVEAARALALTAAELARDEPLRTAVKQAGPSPV